MRFFVAVFFLITSTLGAQVSWRLSDALGNDRGPGPQSQGSRGWVLRVEPRAGGEVRTLFQDGREESVRILDRDAAGRVTRSQNLRAGVSVWEVSFEPITGLPQTETVFDEDLPSEISTLTFRARVLVRRTVRAPDGTLLFEDRLFHWPDGTLRRLERDGPEGPLAESSWRYGALGRLAGAWSVDEDARLRGERREWVYSEGQTQELLASETGILISRVTEALDVGGTRETKTDPATQRTEVRVSDDRGRILEEVVTIKEVVVQTRRWKYDAQGRILETSVESAGPIEVWSYVYSEDVVEGTLTRDGIVVREETVRDGEKQSVRLYDRGALFLVESWEGGKRTKETYYQKGQIVRERTP